MPFVDEIRAAQIAFVCTEIGRGHPHYLDGLADQLSRKYPDIMCYKTDVFAASGGLPRLAWGLVRNLYIWGSKGGIISSLYGSLRRVGQSRQSFSGLLGILGRDVEKRLTRFSGHVVVSHPLLAAILSARFRVIYQHGELVVPAEAIVSGCQGILVPLPETAERFIKGGIPASQIMVTGLCVESALLPTASADYSRRIDRLQADMRLTVALFSSGACPPPHLKKIVLMTVALVAGGHRPIIFTGHSENLAGWFSKKLRQAGVKHDDSPTSGAPAIVVRSESRDHENRRVAYLSNEIDLFAAPAHERTNWALGLGIPQLILAPHVGSYAPLNAYLALSRNVAIEVTSELDARGICTTLDSLRRGGELARMAARGFGRISLEGFAAGADHIAQMSSR